MTGGLLAALIAAALAGRSEAPRIGDAVPDFSATAIDGTLVSLHEVLRTQRVVVVLFLSTVCPYAEFFGDHIGQLAEEYRSTGVFFVGVNSNQFETAAEIVESAAAHRQGFPIIHDPDARVADRLGASCSPEAYVIDRDRKLRYHGWIQSKLRSPDLKRALDAMLRGKPVRLASTKAFGCAIDRRRMSFASR